jgi:hypothetical protein
MQVDGLKGSAVVTLQECLVQPASATPRPIWNPDESTPSQFRDQWLPLPGTAPPVNAFRQQWELFLRHVALDEPFHWDLLEGAKGVQFAEAAFQAWHEKRFVKIPPLEPQRQQHGAATAINS